jgi:hypothetical protein
MTETLDFDVLLLAHGDPLLDDARETPRAFASRHAATA